MKKLFALLLFLPSAAFADIKQEFVTSAQITVDMPYVVTNKVGTTYSLSGNNITPSVTVGDTTTSGKIGGINVGSLTNGVPAMIQTDTSVTSAGSAFSKTESVIMGDATPSTVTDGVILFPLKEYVVPTLFVTTYGISTVICADVTNSCLISANAADGKNKSKANNFFI